MLVMKDDKPGQYRATKEASRQLCPDRAADAGSWMRVVAVRTAQVVDWLENRYYKAICEVVHEVTGERLKLCFVAARRNFLPDGP